MVMAEDVLQGDWRASPPGAWDLVARWAVIGALDAAPSDTTPPHGTVPAELAEHGG